MLLEQSNMLKQLQLSPSVCSLIYPKVTLMVYKVFSLLYNYKKSHAKVNYKINAQEIKALFDQPSWCFNRIAVFCPQVNVRFF